MKSGSLVSMTPIAIAVSLYAVAASAQQEQWLDYHTGSELRGYRWLELSTNPPPDVALPKLKNNAHFGRWSNGLEPGEGRWFCLDGSRGSGPCDRLFFDRDGDGRLDDETPVSSRQRSSSTAYFDAVKVLFKGEDGPISYHLNLRYYAFEGSNPRLLASAGGWYEGKVNIAGKKRRVQLIDNNVNGAFNDRGTDPSESDRILFTDGNRLDRYLGRYLELDDQLLQIEIARDGAFLKVKPAEGIEVGSVRVPKPITEIAAVGENGHFVRQPKEGKFQLPLGKYRVQGWTIERKDDQGSKWNLSGYSFNRAAEFAVGSDGTTDLKVGEPVLAALQATERKGQVSFSLRLLGSLGETVQILKGNERPRAPQVEIASQKGNYHSTYTFEYG